MIILTPESFKGYYKIFIDPNADPSLQDYINKYEGKYINKLLGSVLGATMIADCQSIQMTGSATSGTLTVGETVIDLISQASGKLMQIISPTELLVQVTCNKKFTDCKTQVITFIGSVTSGTLQVGEIVQGQTSNAQGRLLQIISATELLILPIGYKEFTATGEVLTGLTSAAIWTETSYISSTQTGSIILGQTSGATWTFTSYTKGPFQALNKNLFNPFNINDPNNNYLRQSEGLKNILLAMIWFEFIQTPTYKQTLDGIVNVGVDTAGKMSYRNVFSLAESKYNEALEWIYAIQWYCLWYDTADYCNSRTQYYFQGQRFDAESSDFL